LNAEYSIIVPCSTLANFSIVSPRALDKLLVT
jgi:hypothetical protein